LIPHPKKAYKGGEDAYVLIERLLCVCDGVGGWADEGVDPGLFSKELCRNIEGDYKGSFIKDSFFRLKELLVTAVKKQTHRGSSTCVMALIDKEDPIIRTLNLGDSAYLLARLGNDGI